MGDLALPENNTVRSGDPSERKAHVRAHEQVWHSLEGSDTESAGMSVALNEDVEFWLGGNVLRNQNDEPRDASFRRMWDSWERLRAVHCVDVQQFVNLADLCDLLYSDRGFDIAKVWPPDQAVQCVCCVYSTYRQGSRADAAGDDVSHTDAWSVFQCTD